MAACWRCNASPDAGARTAIIGTLHSADRYPTMYTLARQLLFKLSPETSHELSIDLIGAGGAWA